MGLWGALAMMEQPRSGFGELWRSPEGDLAAPGSLEGQHTWPRSDIPVPHRICPGLSRFGVSEEQEGESAPGAIDSHGSHPGTELGIPREFCVRM